MPDAVSAEVADVTDPGQSAVMVRNVVQRFGRVDLLVNNVGGGMKKELIATSDEEWQHLLTLNLTSVFNCCRAVLPVMREKDLL